MLIESYFKVEAEVQPVNTLYFNQQGSFMELYLKDIQNYQGKTIPVSSIPAIEKELRNHSFVIF